MTIEKWADYKNWVETVIVVKKDYFYRGQRDPSWKLQTTFHRYASDLGLTLIDYLDRVIPEIHYYVSAYHNEIFNLQIPEEFGVFLAILQHHGFPTPLLDWTLSPYIAAYFAFRNVDDKKPQADHAKILYTVTLPVFEKPKVMRDLNLMGINEMTLFPGMDGLCRTMRDQFFSRDIIGFGTSSRGLIDALIKAKNK